MLVPLVYSLKSSFRNSLKTAYQWKFKFNTRVKGREGKKKFIAKSHILDFSENINPLQWERNHTIYF